MNKSDSIKEIATALCKFQGEVEKIKKGNTNPFFKSKYASLSDILNVIREPLTDNGLSFVQFPSGEHGLCTMIMHTSGEWINETYFMKPTKDDPQGAGSVITYQRRYALGAILGLNIDEDDDANKASEPVKKEALTPKHPNWNKVVAHLKNGGTMTDIIKKYTLTKEAEKELLNLLELV
jgi:hypothetical protein